MSTNCYLMKMESRWMRPYETIYFYVVKYLNTKFIAIYVAKSLLQYKKKMTAKKRF